MSNAPSDFRRLRAIGQATRRRNAHAVGGLDGGQHLRARPPVVLREIDLRPWKTAAVNGVQRPPLAELDEGARRPRRASFGLDNPIEVTDELFRARRAE